jgi:hypothetical protein
VDDIPYIIRKDGTMQFLNEHDYVVKDEDGDFLVYKTSFFGDIYEPIRENK